MDEMDDEIREIVHEFLVESHDGLDALDRDLVALEQDPTSADLLGNVFRTLHTIKGTSGLFAFDQLEQIAHAGESLLSKLRDGELRLTDAMTTALLAVVDAVRLLLGDIEETGAERPRDYSALVTTLTELQNPAARAPAAVAEPEPELVPAPVVEIQPEPEVAAPAAPAKQRKSASPASGTGKPRTKRTAKPKAAAKPEPTPEPSPEPEAESPLLGEVLVSTGVASQTDVSLAVLRQELGDERKVGEILVAEGTVSTDDVHKALDTQHHAKRSAVESTIRVDVDLLDSVMRLVGELVLARNQVVQRAAQISDGELNRSMQRLNHIASDLQSGITKMRMQVIDSIWNKLPRMVRDLNVSCGKDVQLVMEGRDTDLDKSILDAIKDPLTHLVRNAVDHGVETPEVRRAAGKPEQGTLKLRAFHEGGQVNIEISDDGAGIDPAKIGAKALEKGLATAEELAVMTPEQTNGLIFRPGFSTAAAVTNVSGRGVGMDVVKTNIERVGGTVGISSVPGRGTTFRIRLPLTLAIAPALMVRCGTDQFAIPQVNVSEVVFLQDADAGTIENFGGAPVYRLRDSLLPLVYLDEVLAIESDRFEDDTRRRIVVLTSEGRQFGVVVDGVLGAQEIVVKPLGPHLRPIAAYAGATITSDGSVALILDAAELAVRAHVDSKAVAEFAGDVVAEATSDQMSLLVTAVGDRRVAVPLSTVTRMEKIENAVVERLGRHEALPYGDSVLYLARVAHMVGAMEQNSERSHLDVIVCTVGERTVGLVVDKVIDVLEIPVSHDGEVSTTGYTTSVRARDHIVELLDVTRVAREVLGSTVGAY